MVLILLNNMILKMRKKLKSYIFYVSNFLGKNFFGDDGFQIMFVYQSTINTLDFQRKKVLNILLLEVKRKI